MIRDGRIARLELVIRHDVQQFGRSALSSVSPRFLRTVMYLATGQDIELPFDRERFAFNYLEMNVSLNDEGVAFTGGVSPRQGQWIALDDDAIKPATLRMTGQRMPLPEFVKRWDEVRRRNREGWPDETPEIAPDQSIDILDLLHSLTGGGSPPTDGPTQ